MTTSRSSAAIPIKILFSIEPLPQAGRVRAWKVFAPRIGLPPPLCQPRRPATTAARSTRRRRSAGAGLGPQPVVDHPVEAVERQPAVFQQDAMEFLQIEAGAKR